MLHRWVLRCMAEWPGLQGVVDARVNSFCRGQQFRGKDVEPSMGEFMALLLLSSRPWVRVASHVLSEFMDRQVLWLCQECPSLAMIGCQAFVRLPRVLLQCLQGHAPGRDHPGLRSVL